MSNVFLQISNAQKVSREAIPHLSFDEFRSQALDMVTNGGKVRITSYNVCYTKLLRVLATPARAEKETGVPAFAWPMEKTTRTDPKRAIAIPTEQMRTYFKVAVITSYSIHYTKLYECRLPAGNLHPQHLARCPQIPHHPPGSGSPRVCLHSYLTGTLHDLGGLFPFNGAGCRITSYNVCYTKLLRQRGTGFIPGFRRSIDDN